MLYGLVFLWLTAFQTPEAPSFHLTGIQVEGARWISEKLVISESYLETGKAYTEQELRSARNRIARLPLVLEVDFSLSKGTSYGSYQLNIAIVETMPFVFRLQYLDTDARLDLLDEDDTDNLDDRPLDEIGDWSIGGRYFFGSYTMVYASTRLLSDGGDIDFADGKPIDFGLTHYDLFGRRIFFNLNLQWTEDVRQVIFDQREEVETDVLRDRPILPSLTLAVPVTGSHWLSFAADYFEEQQVFAGRREVFRDVVTDKRLRLRLDWFYDTTDDGVLPTSGRRIESGYIWEDLESTFDLISDRPLPPGFEARRRETERGAWSLGWDEFVPWYPRTSLFLDLDGEVRLSGGQIERDAAPINQWSLDIGIRGDLWGERRTQELGDLRFDLTAGLGIVNFENFRAETTTFRAFLTFRNRWGLIRLGLEYQDLEREARRQNRPRPGGDRQ